MTYMVTDANKKYVLRIHKPIEGFALDIFNTGYNRTELIQNELEIISALKDNTDLPMQTPVCGTNGVLVQFLSNNTPITMLEWVEGDTVEKIDLTSDIYKDSGIMTAKLHEFFYREANLNKKYVRYKYDQSILPQIAEQIEKAAKIEALKNEQARTILKSIDEIRLRFDELDNMQGKHIVHSDLGKSNVIVGADKRLTPIDFSMCGYSHYYLDIGSIYGLRHDAEGRKHIVEGYKRIRKCEVNPRYVEPYVALGAVLFIAWQYERANEWEWFPGSMERWCRDVFQPLADKKEFVVL